LLIKDPSSKRGGKMTSYRFQVSAKCRGGRRDVIPTQSSLDRVPRSQLAQS
jgi:hypothetical protein